MGERRDGVPDGLPTSPTGRVPQWVVDERLGQGTGDTAWRGSVAASGADDLAVVRRRRRRRGGRALIVALVALALVAVAVVVVRDPGLRSRIEGGGGAPVADRPSPGVDEGARPRTALPEPQPAPSDGSAAYLSTQPGTALPVTWSPCRPIHYVVNTAGMSLDGLALLQSAVAEVSRDSGIRFVYDGTTSESPSADRVAYQPDRYGDRWAPVLVAWAGRTEDPAMTAQVLGLTRPHGVAVLPQEPGSALAFVTGQVELNSDLIGRVQKQLGVKATRTVFLHELGHLMGLDHVQDKGAVMYPEYQPKVVTFTPAEVAALHSLGSGPCRPEV